jgi:nicotinic acid mononucleotide adenylyltransferase
VAPAIFLTDVVLEDVSATAIRSAARNGAGADLAGMAPPEVAEYILKYGLYRN